MAIKYSPINIEKFSRIKLIQILKKASFEDGMSLTSQEIGSSKKPIFWERILDLDLAKKKECYLVYTFNKISPIYIDNIIQFAEIEISLDLFTTHNTQSKQLFGFREKLENTFLEDEDFNGITLQQSFYDNEMNLFQFAYLTKLKVVIE